MSASRTINTGFPDDQRYPPALFHLAKHAYALEHNRAAEKDRLERQRAREAAMEAATDAWTRLIREENIAPPRFRLQSPLPTVPTHTWPEVGFDIMDRTFRLHKMGGGYAHHFDLLMPEQPVGSDRRWRCIHNLYTLGEILVNES